MMEVRTPNWLNFILVFICCNWIYVLIITAGQQIELEWRWTDNQQSVYVGTYGQVKTSQLSREKSNCLYSSFIYLQID